MRNDVEKVIHECGRAAALIPQFPGRRPQQASGHGVHGFEPDDFRHRREPAPARASRAYRYSLQLDPHCPPVTGVPSQLERVFINLFRNAEQAAEQQSGPPHIKVTTRRKGELVQVRIEDNGAGVPAHLVSRVFEPFFTTKKVGAGTGLGLSISHQIVADHHGRIFHEPSPLGGACFVVELPLVNIPDQETSGPAASGPDPEPAPAPPGPSPSSSRGARILMIDDEAALAEMICEYLNMTGHHAQSAAAPMKRSL